MAHRKARKAIAMQGRVGAYKYIKKKCLQKFKDVYGEEIRGIFTETTFDIWMDSFFEYLQYCLSKLGDETKFTLDGLEFYKQAPRRVKIKNMHTGEIKMTTTRRNYRIRVTDGFWRDKDCWKKHIRNEAKKANNLNKKKFITIEKQISKDAIENDYNVLVGDDDIEI